MSYSEIHVITANNYPFIDVLTAKRGFVDMKPMIKLTMSLIE